MLRMLRTAQRFGPIASGLRRVPTALRLRRVAGASLARRLRVAKASVMRQVNARKLAPGRCSRCRGPVQADRQRVPSLSSRQPAPGPRPSPGWARRLTIEVYDDAKERGCSMAGRAVVGQPLNDRFRPLPDIRGKVYGAGMDEQPMTRFDVRLRSGGYILPALGIFAWIIGVGGPVVAWLTNTPVYNRNTGQPESALSLSNVLFAVASAVIGTILIRVGGAIRRAYRNGRRSGF